MKKIWIVAVLLAGITTLTLPIDTSVVAQEKKKEDKKKVESKSEKADGSMYIEIGEGKDGKFRFTIRYTTEDKFLANSAAFATEKDARKAIEDLKAMIGSAKVSMKKDKDDK